MEKIWVKDVKDGERVKSLFIVARKAVPTAKSGKAYLSVTLVDRTGELEARSFDRVEELSAQFEEKDLVEVEGPIGTFQGKPQLRLESAVKADPAAHGADPADFAWAPPPEPKKPERQGADEATETLFRELVGLVEAITDPHVKNLVKAFLEDDDLVARLRRAPAAKSVHHAYTGGLLEHTVSCLKLAHRLADQYPQLDRDLLAAGAFFHDLGKVRELSFDRTVEYTDEGRLVGHLVMTAQWIHEKARRVGVPRDLEQHVVHLVLSHHGKMEYGSPKVPMTLEALVTHFIDDLDSRMNSWVTLMGKEGGTRRWTDSQNIYGHHLWRGTLPTVQVEKKPPPPELLTPVIYVPRESPQASGESRKKEPGRKQKPARPPRPERSEEKGAEAAAAGTAAEPQRVETASTPEAPQERPPRPVRPQRPDRPDRGPRGAGGPGDRQRRYMGPRLPGDRGPPPRSDKPKSLTHNPFAALAAKVEASQGPAEPAPEPTPEAPPAPEPAPAAEPAVEAMASPPVPEGGETHS